MRRGALDVTVRNVVPAEVEEQLGLLGRDPDVVVCRMADYEDVLRTRVKDLERDVAVLRKQLHDSAMEERRRALREACR